MTNPRTTITEQGIHVLKHDTHISRWVEEHKSLICDPHLFKWLLPKIAGAKVIWDLGAFVGDHTAAYLAMPGVEKVYAFEPNPDAFYCLERNVGELSRENPSARCYNVAVSDRRERVGFQPNANAGASSLTEFGAPLTQTVALDNFMQGTPPPDFIKIDVEGYEVRALRGMAETLHVYRPEVFVEINAGALALQDASAKQIFKFFEDLGYSGHKTYPENVSLAEPQYDALFCP